MCPTEVHIDENKHRVEELILQDRQVTVTELETAIGLARYQIHQLIHELGFQKICARWVPKMLTEDHLMIRRVSMLELLEGVVA